MSSEDGGNSDNFQEACGIQNAQSNSATSLSYPMEAPRTTIKNGRSQCAAGPSEDLIGTSNSSFDAPPNAKVPKKGILKTKQTSSYNATSDGSLRFDEMNILATLHPVDKDYGHMKIDEPKTPYERGSFHTDCEDQELDAQELVEKLADVEKNFKNRREKRELSFDSDDESSNLSAEEKTHRKKFEEARKKHYDEGSRLQEGRHLIEMGEGDDDEEDDGEETATVDSQP